jgi:hypothetical protein
MFIEELPRVAMPSLRVMKAAGAIAVLGLVFVAGRLSGPDEATSILAIDHPAPGVTTIQVPVEELTPDVVEGYIAPANLPSVDILLAENRNLEVLVTELSLSLATATSEGGGVAVVTPIETPPNETTFGYIPLLAGLPYVAPPWRSAAPTEAPPLLSVPPDESRVAFNDFRLNFLAEGADAKYTLSQKFVILNTTGRNEKNVPTNLIRLYEIGPGETRTPIPVTETTTIAAAATPPHWYVKFGVQGGVGRIAGPSGASSLTVFVGTPWLKRGNNRSTEKTRWAIATPVVAHNNTETSFGMLPVSLNLGTVMSGAHPLTNLWVSPYIGTTSGTSINRIGGLFSVTF